MSLDLLRQEKLGWGGCCQIGTSFFGRYMKMGQSRTRDGWGVQRGRKKWDVLYGCSPITTISNDKFLQKFVSGEELCIFGVPLEVAVERQRCHDGISLPMVVRLCIDHVEENGLMLEGIYRSSGVKSKVNKLRVAFNSRTCSGINLNDYEPAVVASVLKLVN